MDSYKQLFPRLVEQEGEEVIHDEGLLVRFWGAWLDCCMICLNVMASDLQRETFAGNLFLVMWSPHMLA